MERKGGEGERESLVSAWREREIGSEGAPVLRVKGELGLEGGSRSRGMGTWCHFFHSFMKIVSGPVIIPTERIYDRSALHVVT